jgi:hypothetical protein
MPEFLNSPVDMALGAILGMAVPWVMIGLIWWWLTCPTTGADRRRSTSSGRWKTRCGARACPTGSAR